MRFNCAIYQLFALFFFFFLIFLKKIPYFRHFPEISFIYGPRTGAQLLTLGVDSLVFQNGKIWPLRASNSCSSARNHKTSMDSESYGYAEQIPQAVLESATGNGDHAGGPCRMDSKCVLMIVWVCLNPFLPILDFSDFVYPPHLAPKPFWNFDEKILKNVQKFGPLRGASQGPLGGGSWSRLDVAQNRAWYHPNVFLW